MIAQIKDMTLGMEGDLRISLSVPRAHTDELKSLKDEQLDVTIKKYRAHRGLDANGRMWCICREIAQAMPTPHTDREIYRHAIRDVGEYVTVPIKNIGVDAFIERWGKNGIGWFAEVEDDSKIKDHKRVRIYYGSSTYSTLEMSRLLDYLTDEAQQMGIVLMASKEQIEEAKRRWGNDAS